MRLESATRQQLLSSCRVTVLSGTCLLVCRLVPINQQPSREPRTSGHRSHEGGQGNGAGGDSGAGSRGGQGGLCEGSRTVRMQGGSNLPLAGERHVSGSRMDSHEDSFDDGEEDVDGFQAVGACVALYPFTGRFHSTHSSVGSTLPIHRLVPLYPFTGRFYSTHSLVGSTLPIHR